VTNEANVFFVDTNIVVYAYDARDEAKQARAAQVIEALTASGRGMISLQVLKEFCNAIVRKKFLEPAEADEVVRRYVESWPVKDVGHVEIRRAIPVAVARQMRYYDALILVTARDHGASFILTEDEQSAPVIEGVRYLNPFAPDFDLAQLS
jgi:predicted nucleic acid-binding protein